MPINEEQFEAKIADALKLLGADAESAVLFAISRDGDGKVCFRLDEQSFENKQRILMLIMSASIELLTELNETGDVGDVWFKED